ncbi:hypothetical protein BJ165DRAFT_1535066 [Panaeolus papilionaceus]|nr:hypothetical protein BJ165DRAFT_1535066 [Panaeolus papilionaceus]
MSAPAAQEHPTSIPFLDQAPLTEDNAFSRQSPFYTMFIHKGNNRMLDQFKSDGSLEDDFKVQNIVLYGGFRLTEILSAGMRYARVDDMQESMRRLTWIQVGLQHELRYFLSYVGLAAASGWSNKLDIPPIITYLSSAFGIATPEDLPVSIDDRLFDFPLFSSWVTNCGGWVSTWWLDPDFNMDRPEDPLNKTLFIHNTNILEALCGFWKSYEAFKIAEHTAVTETQQPHTSKQSRWRRTKDFLSPGTCLTTSWDNWNDMYVGLHGRRWANPDPTQPPYPSIDILGWADHNINYEENHRRYEGQDINRMLTGLRKDMGVGGLGVQQWHNVPEGEQPGRNDPPRPDLNRLHSMPTVVNEPLQLAGARLMAPAPEPSAPSPLHSAWRTASAVRRPCAPSNPDSHLWLRKRPVAQDGLGKGKAHAMPQAGSTSAGPPHKKSKPTQGTATGFSAAGKAPAQSSQAEPEPDWENTIDYGADRLKKVMQNVGDDQEMEDGNNSESESDGGFGLAVRTGRPPPSSEPSIVLGNDDDSDGGLAAAVAGTSIAPIVVDDLDSELDGGLRAAVAASMMTSGRPVAGRSTGNSENADDEDDEEEEDEDDEKDSAEETSDDEDEDEDDVPAGPATQVLDGDIEMKDHAAEDDEEEEEDEFRAAILGK